MIAIFRGLVRAFGILPVVAILALIWFVSDRAAQDKATKQHEIELLAEEGECFGAYTSGNADGFDTPIARITSVKRNSPAYIAGLEAGDVITAENGMPIQGLRLWQRQPLSGQAVALSVERPDTRGGYQNLRIIVLLGQCSIAATQPN